MSAFPKQSAKPAEDHEILNQNWFKSVGPRTYAAQVKKAKNGNHFLVLTEGRRDEKTGQVLKNRIFLYSEDFAAFFKMMHETAVFIRENPVPEAVKKRQDRKWARQNEEAAKPADKAQATVPLSPSRRPGSHAFSGPRQPARAPARQSVPGAPGAAMAHAR